MNLADPETHFAAVVALLADAGLTVGEGDAAGLSLPYVVVYLMPSSGPSGPVGAYQDDETMSFQTTCVHRTARGVEWVKNQVRQVVYSLTVTGRRVHVTRDLEFQTSRDPDVEQPVFFGGDRWSIWSTPTG